MQFHRGGVSISVYGGKNFVGLVGAVFSVILYEEIIFSGQRLQREQHRTFPHAPITVDKTKLTTAVAIQHWSGLSELLGAVFELRN